MKKYILALFIVAAAATGAAAATETQVSLPDRGIVLAQVAPAPNTTVVETSAPVTSTTVVKGGNLAAEVIQWIQVAFIPVIGTVVLAVLYKIFGYFGIQTTEMQRTQLQSIVVNGLNAAAANAQVSLRSSDKLDFSSKSAIVNDAVRYAQEHAAETIKALGLDPQGGEAVEAIKARIETALNDPNTPTPPAITPQPVAKVA